MCGSFIAKPLQAIGLLPDPPKAPKPAEALQAAPTPPPVMSDPGVAQARTRERQRLALARGRRSTILTSPQGVTSPSQTAPVKTLLGS